MKEKSITMKGIATETIAKMLIVIIVVGIVVYLIYRYVLNSALGETACRGLMSTWCANCEMSKSGDTYEFGSSMSTKLQECITKYSFASFHSSCADLNTNNDCKGFIPHT